MTTMKHFSAQHRVKFSPRAVELQSHRMRCNHLDRIHPSVDRGGARNRLGGVDASLSLTNKAPWLLPYLWSLISSLSASSNRERIETSARTR